MAIEGRVCFRKVIFREYSGVVVLLRPVGTPHRATIGAGPRESEEIGRVSRLSSHLSLNFMQAAGGSS